LTPREAANAILRRVRPLTPEILPLLDALGRVCAKTVTSPIDIPAWDNSAMDGYAARSDDLRERQEVALHVVETITAGQFPTCTIGAGQCARIFTGAPVPHGADTVIRQEDISVLPDGTIRIDALRDVGKNVRPRGEDITRGATVCELGREVGPAQIAVLAAIAARIVEVYRVPTVAIMGSGDEIVDLDQRDAILDGRKIASSNSYAMAAMARAVGAVPRDLGIARDDPREVRERLEQASTADMIVTSGGMSVGEHDHLRKLLQDAGSDMQFWRLKSRPGAPVGFGIINGTPWLGLPGNPVSTMVTFELFVRPALRKMMGHEALFRRPTSVRLGEPISTPARLTHFLRVCLTDEAGMPVAHLTGPQGSGIASSMAKADALLIVPEHVSEASAGEVFQAMRLNEAVHVTEVPF
jgi:molybdopterin molybdotransferase